MTRSRLATKWDRRMVLASGVGTVPALIIAIFGGGSRVLGGLWGPYDDATGSMAEEDGPDPGDDSADDEGKDRITLLTQ